MAFCFRNSLCGGGRYDMSAMAIRLQFTLKAFRFLNSLCGGGRYDMSAMAIRLQFRY